MGSADYSAITESVVTGMTAVQGEMMTVISSIVPIALVVVGAVLVVRLGIRVFRSVTGR